MKRSRSYGDFDLQTLRDAFSGPGMDPREWVSYAIVDADGESDEEKSVVFDEDMGPLVNVTLHPAGKQVRCRVASFVAGNGEADWYPFLEKDEVLVVMPEGSERNAIIIARLNQSVDKFPTMVGGADVTKNNVAFRRIQAPYVFECGSNPYFVTQAATGASFLIDKAGQVYVKNGEGSVMYLGADWIGFSDKDPANGFTLQYHYENKAFQVLLNGGVSQLTLSEEGQSTLMTAGPLGIGTGTSQPFWHATSIESVVNLLYLVGLTWTPPVDPLTFAGKIIAAATTPMPPDIYAAVQAAIIKPPGPSPAGLIPGVGCPNFLIG